MKYGWLFVLGVGLWGVVACGDNPATGDAGTSPDSGIASDSGSISDSGLSVDGGLAQVTIDEVREGGDCPAPTGSGTMHQGFIESDETWSFTGSPHIVPNAIRITATVTIEPCARVQLGPEAIIEVGSTTEPGRLVALGEVTGTGAERRVRPIQFVRNDSASAWGKILVQKPGSVELALVAMRGGGDVSVGSKTTFESRGAAGGSNDGPITRNVKMNDVLIEGSASHGIVLLDWSAFTADSRRVWIENSGGVDAEEAMTIEPGIAGTLPEGLTFTGNRRNEIRVETSKVFMRNDAFRSLGIPYRIASTLYVSPYENGPPVTLQVEPGVTIAFESNRGIAVGSTKERRGILIAEGTTTEPITFTSAAASKTAGDWPGIVYRYIPPLGNRLKYARVEYAGGESGTTGFGCGPSDNDSAIIIYGQDDPDTSTSENAPPSEVFIQNTTFDSIGGYTVIVSGWTDDAGPNFSTSNTFGPDTAPCKVSKPQRSGGGDTCDGGRNVCWP